MEGYTSYQHLQLGWTDILPSHWGVKRLKRVLSERKENNNPVKTNEILSLTNTRGVIPYSEKGNIGNKSKENIEGYHLTYPNDLVVNSMNVVIGSVGVSDYFGAISPVYYALMSRGEANIKYYEYIFRLPSFEETLKGLGNGILEIRMRIPMSKLNNVLLPLPPRVEQDQIVRFLDWKVSEINKLIGIRRKEIQELGALKSAVINSAITRGIDANAAMKKTGVYYLPKVPASWEVTKLKRICKVGASINDLLRKHSDQDEVVFLPMENISEDGEIDCSIKQPIAKVKTGFSSFAKNDVVVAKITPCFENGKGACLDKLESDIGYGTTELFNLRAGNDVLPEYLYFITMTKLFRILGEGQMTGSAGQKRVPADFIRDFTIGLPPIDEQQEIVDYIRSEKGRIDRLIATKHEQLKALTEFKSSVVSDAVTGKIDVRNVTVPEYEHVDDICDDNSESDEESDETEMDEEV